MRRDIKIKEVKAESIQYKLKQSYECATEQQNLLNKKKLEDIEFESQKVTREIESIEQAISIIENEHRALQMKLESIRAESELISDQISSNKHYEVH